MGQVLFIRTSVTRGRVSKTSPKAGAGTGGAPFALTDPSPSLPSLVGQGACLGEKRRGSLGQRLWQPLLCPTLNHLPCGLYWRWERRPENFPLEWTAEKPIACLRRWEVVGTSLSASKDPPFPMEFRPLKQVTFLCDEKIH